MQLARLAPLVLGVLGDGRTSKEEQGGLVLALCGTLRFLQDSDALRFSLLGKKVFSAGGTRELEAESPPLRVLEELAVLADTCLGRLRKAWDSQGGFS